MLNLHFTELGETLWFTKSESVSVVPGYARRQSGGHAGRSWWNLRGWSKWLQRAISIRVDRRRSGPGWHRWKCKSKSGVIRRRGRRTRGGASHRRRSTRRRSTYWRLMLRWRTERERNMLMSNASNTKVMGSNVKLIPGYHWYWYLGSLCIQVSSTGGGKGTDTVLVLMSPMMCRDSLRAWYIRNISSLCCACSADSSIRLFWSADE